MDLEIKLQSLNFIIQDIQPHLRLVIQNTLYVHMKLGSGCL